MQTKYVGCVTDEIYHISLIRSSREIHELEKIRNKKYNWDFEKCLDIIFSSGRLPRFYKD